MLIGDREFGTFNRIELYQSLGIPFVVRLKEQWHYIKQDSDSLENLLHRLFEGLKEGEFRTIYELRLGQKGQVICSVSAKRKTATELIIIAHCPNVKDPLKAYKRRWRIERMFLECKTQGFHLESTGITHPQRLQNLFMVIALSSAIILSKAIDSLQECSIAIKKRIPLDASSRPASTSSESL